jgi:putative redox protein
MGVERITFPNARGDVLCGMLHHPFGEPAGAVILCHGMDSDKNSRKLVYLGHKLAEAGVLALRFDFAYVGESSGKFEDITYSGEVGDLTAAYALIAERLPRKKIALLGSSMGGTIALLFAAAEPSVAAVVTVAAPVHPEEFPARILTPTHLQQWRERGFVFYNGQRLNVSLLEDLERLNVPRSAKNVKCPVLIVHGDGDEVVPVKEAFELHECLTGPKRLSILKGADHRISDTALMQRALAESFNWLLEHAR